MRTTMMTTSPLLKFFIGFVAGLCAAIVPRLMPVLSSERGEFNLFPASYVAASLVFGTLIGAVMMIVEWGQSHAPKDTFMTALAVPGLLSGSINMAIGVNELQQTDQENQKLIEQLLEAEDIKIDPVAPPHADAGEPGAQTSSLLDFLVPSAHAAGASIPVSNYLGFGIIQQRHYVVVLSKTATEAQARSRLERLQHEGVPDLRVIRAGPSFLVIQGAPLNQANAALAAVRLKKRYGVEPAVALLQ